MKPPLIGLTTVRAAGADGRVRDSLTLDYAQAIVQAGGLPVLIPLSMLNNGDVSNLHALYKRFDGILLPGGGDVHPDFYHEDSTDALRGMSRLRDQVEIELSRWAYQDHLPLLGICRGHQLLNVALGGSLHQDIKTMQNGSSTIQHDADSVLERDRMMHTIDIAPEAQLAHILGCTRLEVNSLHHQSVNVLADALIATAYAPDGILEGVEVTGHPFFIGVQWHPEAIAHLPEMQLLFKAFVAASENRTVQA